MIEALHFKDEKTDKFWFVETLVCEMMVNYGKTGTPGKYEIKEFDNNQDCEKEALKLINSKKKKGYEEFVEFDRNNRYYFDDEEHGLNRLIWNWDKEEATYYIETMRRDLIKYKENF